MARDFALGCHRLTFHQRENISIEREFALIKEAGVFDYVDWLPRPDILDECERCSQKFDLPILTGTYGYVLGRDDKALADDMRNGARLGVRTHNIMLGARTADGRDITDEEKETSKQATSVLIFDRAGALVAGTLITSAVALVIGVPVAVATALFVTELAPARWRSWMPMACGSSMAPPRTGGRRPPRSRCEREDPEGGRAAAAA